MTSVLGQVLAGCKLRKHVDSVNTETVRPQF